MNWETIIDNLNDLIDMKNTKIEGYGYAVEHLKEKQHKVVRELKYLKSQYDSKVERDVMDNVINLVRGILE